MNNNTSSTEYSGTLQEGWNLEGSYSRLQYLSSEILDENSLINIINEGLELISNSENTRLDIRSIITRDFDIGVLKNVFHGGDIVTKTVLDISNIIVGKNFGERDLDKQELEKVKVFVAEKVKSILNFIDDNGGFQQYAISQIQNIHRQGYRFEKNNFGVEEVFALWGENFDWSRDDIESFISNINENIFGLRNQEGNLIALIMIGDDGETTEWGVLKEYQGHGLITPLLIAVNGYLIQEGRGDGVYAHLRWNRSIGPGLKSGLRIDNSFDSDNILTNHVEVEGKMEHFLEAVLDKKLFKDQLLAEINKFIFCN